MDYTRSFYCSPYFMDIREDNVYGESISLRASREFDLSMNEFFEDSSINKTDILGKSVLTNACNQNREEFFPPLTASRNPLPAENQIYNEELVDDEDFKETLKSNFSRDVDKLSAENADRSIKTKRLELTKKRKFSSDNFIMYWSQDDVDKLIELVKLHGTSSWSTVASFMIFDPKQCRDKWNRLVKRNPSLDLAPKFHHWTPEEETTLIKYIKTNAKY